MRYKADDPCRYTDDPEMRRKIAGTILKHIMYRITEISGTNFALEIARRDYDAYAAIMICEALYQLVTFDGAG